MGLSWRELKQIARNRGDSRKLTEGALIWPVIVTTDLPRNTQALMRSDGFRETFR